MKAFLFSHKDLGSANTFLGTWLSSKGEDFTLNSFRKKRKVSL